MANDSFLDLMGGHVPALERNLIKLRAAQVLLAIHYSEELQNQMVDLICTTEAFRNVVEPRLTRETKKARQKALKFLVADGAFSKAESEEIKSLVNFRNDVAHEIHWMFGDLSANRFGREMTDMLNKSFNYDIVERFQYYLHRMDDVPANFGYVMTLNSRAIAFDGAEKTLLDEIEILKKKVIRLWKIRSNQVDAINSEVDLVGTEFERLESRPDHPANKTRDGRLTQKGVEICNRLFESGRSAHAVAFLLRMSLTSVRRRQRRWRQGL